MVDPIVPATAGGGGAVKVQKQTLIMSYVIAVTMHRSSTGYDLQRVDVAATAGIVITLLNAKYGLISK